jgi:hypothetical protein
MSIFIKAGLWSSKKTGYLGELNLSAELEKPSNSKLETVATIAELQAYTASIFAYFDGSTWEKKSGNVISNGGSFAGTLIRVSSSVYWERNLINNSITLEMFGGVGNGSTNCTTALNNALDVCQLKKYNLSILSGIYLITSLITKPISGFRIFGIKGSSTLTYSFGYSLLNLTGLTNGSIEGISFVSTNNNSAEDQGGGIIYSYSADVINFTIANCYFTNTNSNSSAISLYTNTAANGTKIISNLVIESNIFENIGRIGCTIMNRSDKTLCQNVKFNNNTGINLGTQGSYGFLVSLDGYGQNGEVSGNYIKNALGIGIENTGYDNFIFDKNTFTGTTLYNPFGFSHPQAGEYINNNVITNNIAIGLLNGCYFYEVNNSTFSGNVFSSTATDIVFRNNNSNIYVNEHYSGVRYGFYIETNGSKTSRNNIISNCFFTSSNNYSIMRCYGANNTNNNFVNNIITFSGGVIFDELSGASGNKCTRNIVNGVQTDSTENTFTSNTNLLTVKATQYNLTALNSVPATSTSTGTVGEIRWANGFVYLCVATNTWQRSALTTW